MRIFVATVVAVLLFPGLARAQIQLFNDWKAQGLAVDAQALSKKQERRLDGYVRRLDEIGEKLKKCQDGAAPCDHNELEQGIKALKAELGIVDVKGKKRPKTKIQVLEGLYYSLRKAQENGWKELSAKLKEQLAEEMKKIRAEDLPAIKASLLAEIREAITLLNNDAAVNQRRLNAAVAEVKAQLERLKKYERQLEGMEQIKTDLKTIREHLAEMDQKLKAKQDTLRFAVGGYGRWLHGQPTGYGGGVRFDLDIPNSRHPLWHTVIIGSTGYEYAGWAMSAQFMQEVGAGFRFRFGLQTELSVGDKGIMMTPALPIGFAITGGGVKFFAETGPAWRVMETDKKVSMIVQGGILFYLQ